MCLLAAGRSATAHRPDTPGAAIAREIARMETDRATLGNQADAFADGIGRVKDAVSKNRLFFALDELQEPWTFDAAMRWANAHAAITSAEQFSAEWKRVGEPALSTRPTSLPSAVEAIAASNAIRAPATWRASLPYAEDAGMSAGLYYLGEAQAFAAFAEFCRSLPFDRRGAAPSFKPMAREIAALEAQAATLYDTVPADTKPRFIRVSVGLKIARTLDEHGDRGAALYQYLVARYRAGVAVAPQTRPGDVKTRLESARSKLTPGIDHSIGELFLQRAAYLLETGDPSAARSAAVIADTVLPDYLRLVAR